MGIMPRDQCGDEKDEVEGGEEELLDHYRPLFYIISILLLFPLFLASGIVSVPCHNFVGLFLLYNN